jgi:hypothetical protein
MSEPEGEKFPKFPESEGKSSLGQRLVSEHRRLRRRELAEKIFVAACPSMLPYAFGINDYQRAIVDRVIRRSYDLADDFMNFDPEKERDEP